MTVKPMHRRLAAALAALALLVPAGGRAATLDPTAWRYSRMVTVPGPGVYRLLLDPEVVAAARADLADLRLADAGKAEVPFQVEIRREQVQERTFPVRLSDLTVDAAAGTTTFLADVGGGEVTSRLYLQAEGRDFWKQVSVEAADEAGAWRQTLQADYIYDLSAKGGGRRLDVSYPPTRARYLRVTIRDLGTPPLRISGAELQLRERVPAEAVPWPAAVAEATEEPGRSRVVLDLGARTPVHALTVATAAWGFHRPVTLEASDNGATWSRAGIGVLYRYAGGAGLTLAFPEVFARYLRLTIENGSDSPLPVDSATAAVTPRRIVFAAGSGQGLRLLYGNPAAQAPRYDLARFQGAHVVDLPAGVLGDRERVVLDAGAAQPPPPPPRPSDADPRLWRYEHRLEVAGRPAGLYALVLDPAVLQAGRPDLADLRLVNPQGLDVPYRVEQGAAVPWPGQVAGRGQVGQEKDTWLALDLGAPGLPVHALRFTVGADAFTREVAVEGSDDGAGWRHLGVGIIRRVQTVFGPEENLAVAFPEVRYRFLRVTVRNRGAEPVALLSAAPYGRERRLILAHTGGDQAYRLFYGNPAAGRPAAGAPVTEAFRPPEVLPPAALGPAIVHRPEPGRPGFLAPVDPGQAPDSQWVRWALWGLLAVLVAGLGLVIVRVGRQVLRQPPPPPDGDGAP